jgi:hypothetical protein
MDSDKLKAIGIIEETYNSNTQSKNTNNDMLRAIGIEEDSSNAGKNLYLGVIIICFLIPFIGLIGYVIHIKNDYELACKCLNSAICGIVSYIILMLVIVSNS